MGFYQAGFEVMGVDIHKQENYPFEFHQMDAMEVVANKQLLQWEGFHVIHAAPPCQSYSAATRHLAYIRPKYIEELRELLIETGLPYVIENVNGAPLYPKKSITLCGTMFGKHILRHRIFESNIPLINHLSCHHEILGKRGALQPTYNGQNRDWMTEMFDTDLKHKWWMTIKEARQAMPPCYTEYIGLQLLEHLEGGELKIA